jgi:hypothetical protein
VVLFGLNPRKTRKRFLTLNQPYFDCRHGGRGLALVVLKPHPSEIRASTSTKASAMATYCLLWFCGPDVDQTMLYSYFSRLLLKTVVRHFRRIHDFDFQYANRRRCLVFASFLDAPQYSLRSGKSAHSVPLSLVSQMHNLTRGTHLMAVAVPVQRVR